MNRVFKYLARTILAIFLLLILVVFLLYLPPMQNFIRVKAIDYISAHYGWDVKVGHFRLGFPLDLTLKDVYAGRTAVDTLMAAESLHLKVGLSRIFRKEVSIDDLALQNVKLEISNDTSGMRLRVAVDGVHLQAKRVDLIKRVAEVQKIYISGGKVILATGENVTPDTIASKPFDWTFLVEHIELHQVDYRMNTIALPELSAGVTVGRIVGGKVFLGLQSVEADSVGLEGGWCRMLTAQVSDASKEKNMVVEGRDTLPSLPWAVRAGSVQLENSAFSMEAAGQIRTEMVLSGIGIQIDSVYNRGTTVRGILKDLKAVQKDGIQIVSMQAGIGLNTSETILRGAYIQTPNSRIHLDARADTSVQHLMEEIPLVATLDAWIGLADLAPFYSGIPAAVSNKTIEVNTSFAITDDRLQVDRLLLSMPGHFRITGNGKLASYRNLKAIDGNFDLRGDLPDATFVNSFLKGIGVYLPRDLSISANLNAREGGLKALFRLCCGKGCLTLDAGYHITQKTYNGDLTLSDFPLSRFMPGDSLGIVTANVKVGGRGFSWPAARAEVTADIDQFTYRNYEYQDIALYASLDKTRLRGTLTARDTAAPLDLVFRGDSAGHDYTIGLSGRIGEIDLKALNFVQEVFSVGTDIDLTATVGSNEKYLLRARFDSLKMTDAQRNYVLSGISLDMNSDRQKTELQFITGDLKMEFQADTSLAGFSESVGKVAKVLQKQIAAKDIDMELIKQDLPVFDFKLEGAQENIVARFLKARNIGFQNLALDVVSRQRTGLRVGIQANAPFFGTVQLDSVQFGAWQTGKSLVYSFAAGSSSEAWKGLFNINMSGRMQGDRFRLELKQKDASGNVGFDLGANMIMSDTAFSVSFFPMTPILGYSRWIVNADNRITVGKDWKVNANLRMSYLNKLVNVQSLGDLEDMKDRLQVEINGIDLAALSQVLPFMPKLEGILGTDVLLYSWDQMLGADGSIKINNMAYQEQRIGTIELGLHYSLGNHTMDHAVEFELKIDSVHRTIAKGTFSTSETNRNVAVDMDISSFPLYIANTFVPASLMKLYGVLAGTVHFRGTVDQPELNGELAFHNGKADVVMLGTTFGLDTTRLFVRDGKILFHKYRFIAPNNSDMVVNGEIKLTPFDVMNMDLAVTANNFEVVNVNKNPTSLIYGKAYANINSRIAGAFSSLNVTGNVDLLNRTNVTYTLRNSDAQAVDRSIDLVRFVSFRDSTLNEKDELTNRINPSSFMMKMLIEIGDEVRVAVDLSEDGSNNVSIQGGGNLVLAMYPESGMTLSGKYILTGGTVVYNVPIAGKKEFSISNGSFVEWTGNVTNPTLNISASEQVKATVEDGDRNRLVTFESIIRIQNSLTRPDISFDLSAPNDMVIQNQLATFSQEERTRQALNLLIYNTYTAPGAAKSGSGSNVANNAIYSFVENELNKYTKKAGFTLGVDSYNTDENTTRTDYTYQFSKQLFNDRVRVKIGGRISTDNNEGQSNNLQDNLVDDISIEYILTTKRNLYAKVFRHSNYESVLDGEVIQTGVGIVWRKNFRKFKDLFKNRKKLEMKDKIDVK